MCETDLIIQLIRQQGEEMRTGFKQVHDAISAHADDDSRTFQAHSRLIGGHGSQLENLNLTVARAHTLSQVVAWVGGILSVALAGILTAFGIKYLGK